MSQPHSPPSSAVGREGGGNGDVSGVEEKGDKSVVNMVPAQTTATCSSSPRSSTPPPEDFPTRKAGARRRAESDTQQSMVDVSFFILHNITLLLLLFNPVQTAV